MKTCHSRIYRQLGMALALACLIVAVSCAAPTPTPTASSSAGPRLRNTPFVANTPVGSSAWTAGHATPFPESTAVALSPSGPAPFAPNKVNLDAIAPPGRARDLLIMSCDNCHSFVCALRHQRTIEHWGTVQRTHEFYEWGTEPLEEFIQIFTYLESHFTDRQPEPILPALLDDQGCTTSADQ